ncbi:hypothetical protein PsorP6_009140 [Peronosclerospora sorghi]|uniref:Uncharacterized protein n=1 Tax=Peronosclerospora sorghi TaxID=230839 RepID=A0ACC0VXW8_9STRA|nr:hypothetical protein PsorP6_009140 [Peronosclerospora sorghi]
MEGHGSNKASLQPFPALLLVILTQKLPDSPTWLLARHDDRDASFQVLYQLLTRDRLVAEQETNAIIHAEVLAKATARRHHGAFFRPVLLCIGLVKLRAVSGFLLEPMMTSTLRRRLDRLFLVTIFGVAVEGSEDDVFGGTLTVAGAAATRIVACYYLVDTRGRLVALQCGAYAVAIACAFLLVAISNGTGDTDAFLCDSGWAAILFANAGHLVGLGVVPVILVSELFAVKQRLGARSLVMIWEVIVQMGLTQLLPLLRDAIRVVCPCSVSVLVLSLRVTSWPLSSRGGTFWKQVNGVSKTLRRF